MHLVRRVRRAVKNEELEVMVLVEGEGERELVRMERWYHRLQVDGVEHVLD